LCLTSLTVAEVPVPRAPAKIRSKSLRQSDGNFAESGTFDFDRRR
jgi:hypothetical protein